MVYGGCVTRDAYTLLENKVGLVNYTARQSLISAMSEPTDDLPDPELKSAFQKRMVLGDFRSNLMPIADQADLIVMDTNIERLGVFQLSPTQFITRSHEMFKSNVIGRLPSAPRWIPIRDPEYPNLYERAVARFSSELEKEGIKEKVLVINAPMARKYAQGDPINTYRNRPAKETQDRLSTLGNILKRNGFIVANMPVELAVADESHNWGKSPFHYTEPATRWTADIIDATLAQRR